MIKSVVLTFFCFYSVSLSAQKVDTVLSDINYYADVTANGSLASTRARGHEALSQHLQNWLSSSDYSDEALDSVAYISAKRPDDRSWTIITWQLLHEDKSYSYYGYIRTADGKVIKLESDHSANLRDLPYETLYADNWYGALYYNIMPTRYDGKSAYLLYGYDGHEGYEHRKILDVLYMDDSKPVFGAPIFEVPNAGRRGGLANRLVVEYSNDANVSLNYNPDLEMIIHDHLISRMGRMPGQGPTMIPDGSYIGYKLDKDQWKYIEKVYDQVSSSPPTDNKKRPADKTIFGSEKVTKGTKKRD